MGITYIEGTVVGPTGKEATLELLVDTGSMYTVLPHRVWQAIELQPERTEGFRLMDGTKIERQMSDCRIRLPQGEGPTFVVLGEPGDEALLGVHTLEGFGLMVNPFPRELVPMRLRQGAAATGQGAALVRAPPCRPKGFGPRACQMARLRRTRQPEETRANAANSPVP